MNPHWARKCGDLAVGASQGICEGCFRSIEEIMAWGQLPDSGKRAVWVQIAQRATVLGQTAPALPPGWQP
jgi:predicted Fe-S protein YdhL (DUF1289 family)